MNKPLSRTAWCTLVTVSFMLAGCGGGSPPVVQKIDKSSLPKVSVSGGFASLPPNTGGGVNYGDVSVGIKFKVTLSAQPNGVATVGYSAIDGIGGDAAKGGLDFTKTVKEGNTITFQPGETSKIIDISIIGGGSRHPHTTPVDKSFYLVLQNPSANITLGTAQATGTIMYAPGLNDTGIITCAIVSAKHLPCEDSATGTDQYPVQDAEFGRDIIAEARLLNKVGAGDAAFDFTRMVNGAPLTHQTTPYATTRWDCVRDNVTGLVWEVKIPDTATGYYKHHAGNTYTWFKAGKTTNKPDYGTPGGTLTCMDSTCDTDHYVAAVNLEGYWLQPLAHAHRR
ncbi:MAG TPA: hypothetical protein VKA13_01480 [Gammaproteobacteria bacterium]|nr:hypothetical protein [Gammaproteobacteria bacterium]